MAAEGHRLSLAVNDALASGIEDDLRHALDRMEASGFVFTDAVNKERKA